MTRLQSVIAGIWLAVIALVTTTVASAAPTRLVADLSQSHVAVSYTHLTLPTKQAV